MARLRAQSSPPRRRKRPSEGFDWLLAVTAAETLAPDIFVKMQPALRVHDAVWGGAALAAAGGPPPKLERITRLAAQDLPTFFHAALAWWIGPSHFVRPASGRSPRFARLTHGMVRRLHARALEGPAAPTRPRSA